MTDTPPHLQALEEIECEGIPSLVEVLREEGIDAVRCTLWDATSWHRDYSPLAWRNRATEEQTRMGWEMAVSIEKILSARSCKRATSGRSKRPRTPYSKDQRNSTEVTWAEGQAPRLGSGLMFSEVVHRNLTGRQP